VRTRVQKPVSARITANAARTGTIGVLLLVAVIIASSDSR
jgi:hypothetical protein